MNTIQLIIDWAKKESNRGIRETAFVAESELYLLNDYISKLESIALGVIFLEDKDGGRSFPPKTLIQNAHAVLEKKK